MFVSIAHFATLLVTVVIGVCVVYATVEMRKMYSEQRQKLARATFAVEELQKLRAETILFLRRVESDGHALQKIASQIEAAIAELKHGVSSATIGAAERQTAAIDTLRDQMDAQEQRLVTIAETIAESLRSFSATRETASEVHESTNQSRLRRESLSQDPGLRFEVLKEWIAINTLAILHRASRPWSTAHDLIAHIPAYLEAEAEILDHSILLIGTRQHSERLAIPLRELSSSSIYRLWFDPPSQGQSITHAPAILMRSNGHFKLVTKGTDSTGITN